MIHVYVFVSLLLLPPTATPAAIPADFIVMRADAAVPDSPAVVRELIVLPGAGNITSRPAPGHVDGHLAIVENAAPHLRAFGPLGGKPCGRRVRFMSNPRRSSRMLDCRRSSKSRRLRPLSAISP